MGNKIQFKRGRKEQIPTLNYGEPGFVSDEQELYIGTETGNIKLTSKTEINTINSQLESISINIKKFGAIGDGINDDTISIKKTLEYINTKGGGTVLIPKGEYLWSKELTVYENTTIKCDSEAILKRNHNGPFLCNGIKGYNYIGEYSAHSNIIIDGGIWEGNTNRQQTGYNMLNFGKGKNILIQNATFKDYSGGHVLDISGCKDIKIDNCKFIGFRPTANREFAEAIQLAEHTELGFSSFGGWDHSICENVIISNCYFGKSGTTGTFGVNGIGGHSSTHNIFNRNIKIINNTFEDSYHSAIRCFKWQNVLIDGNTFNRCERGIAISNTVGGSISSQDKDGTQTNLCQSGSNYIITNNKFENCKQNSIYASGQASIIDGIESYSYIENIKITNNIITDNIGENSLSLVLCKNLDIINNIIKNVSRGLRLIYDSYVKINNNIIENCSLEAIYAYESSNVFPQFNNKKLGNNLIINDNVLFNIGKNGIFIQNFSTGVINNNKMEKVSTSFAGTDARNGITISSNTENFILKNNYLKKDDNATNKYGIEVTSTCSNITAENNDCYGTVKHINIPQIALRNYNNNSTIRWNDCVLNEGVSLHSNFKAQYMKNSDGMVVITGALTHDNSYTGTLFTLPEGFRPRQTSFFITNNSMGGSSEIKLSRIKVNTTGEVVLEATNTVSKTPFTSIDIIFYT